MNCISLTASVHSQRCIEKNTRLQSSKVRICDGRERAHDEMRPGCDGGSAGMTRALEKHRQLNAATASEVPQPEKVIPVQIFWNMVPVLPARQRKKKNTKPGISLPEKGLSRGTSEKRSGYEYRFSRRPGCWCGRAQTTPRGQRERDKTKIATSFLSSRGARPLETATREALARPRTRAACPNCCTEEDTEKRPTIH